MSYSIDALTADCYEGTSCLINKFNIKDENKLSNIEAAITFAKASELEKTPINGNFDLEHYLAIHRYLFEDIYDWAGKIRTVEMSKKGTSFAKSEEIEELCNGCFDRLKNMNYFHGMSFAQFVENIVDLYCTINIIHPFREGNGRTQRIFISQLIRYNGYDIDFSAIDADELMIATIHSASGINDYLIDIFSKHIKR